MERSDPPQSADRVPASVQTGLGGAPRLSIILWLWNGFRPIYTAEHVRAISRQLKHYLRMPYRVVLLTDDVDATPSSVEVDAVLPVPGQPTYAPKGKGVANCFRRLRLFDERYARQFGTEWILSLDLDSIVLADMTELVELAMCPGGFSILRGRFSYEKGARPYNGGLYCLRVGAHPHVWSQFDWSTSGQECAATGWIGSDQVWLSLKLPGALTLGPEHGCYFAGQYQEETDPVQRANAKIVTYAGATKPWSKVCRNTTPAMWKEYQRWNKAAT